MGRRKTKKIKPSKSNLALKNRRKLDREFHCHFCQHDRSVSVKMSAVGFLSCRICGVTFSTRITSLDEPVDVYTIWMDKCRETDKALVNKEEDKTTRNQEKANADHTAPKARVEPSDKRTAPQRRERFSPSSDGAARGEESSIEEEGPPNSYEAQPADPYTDISYTDVMKTDLPEEFDEDQMYMNISRNTVTQRIIGADEPSGDFEHAPTSGSGVHDLFQDDE